MASGTVNLAHLHRLASWDRRFEGRYDAIAARLLDGPLSALLGLLAVFQLVQWVPHYLTWPLFPDHDVFASAAQAWDAGRLPYRDALTNNFPGTIYLFWALGKLFGWGRSAPLYAADALFLLVYGVALLGWSRRLFGNLLPGLLAYLSWLGFYLNLDYSLTAQRDWHAGGLMMMALMAAQADPGRRGRFVSALLYAAAATIRPQVGLFLPAWWLALDSGPGEHLDWRRRSLWVGTLGLLFGAMMSPLIAAGVLDDLLHCLKLVSYGGQYNKASLGGFRVEMQRELLNAKLWAVAIPLVLLRPRLDGTLARSLAPWFAAMVAAMLYKPISPVPHAYLIQPFMLAWAVLVGLLTAAVLALRPRMPVLQVVGLLMLLGLQADGRPRFCNFERSVAALGELHAGGEPEKEPMGHEFSPWAQRSSGYKWDDYRATLQYLRDHTRPTTQVANVLRGYPPLASATGRLSVFPAESVAWLILVRPQDEGHFARALVDHPDSVVVWSPEEIGRRGKFRLEELVPTIREHYQQAARFGTIEVWERIGSPADPAAGAVVAAATAAAD